MFHLFRKPYEHKYEPKPYNDYETPHYDSYKPYDYYPKPKYEYKQEYAGGYNYYEKPFYIGRFQFENF